MLAEDIVKELETTSPEDLESFEAVVEEEIEEAPVGDEQVEDPEQTDDDGDEQTVEEDKLTKLAVKWGWNPDGEDDAGTYVENEREINNSLKKKNRRMEDEVSGLGSEIKAMRQMMKKIQKDASSRSTIEIKQTVAELKAKAEEAFESSDRETFDTINAQIQEYESIMPGDEPDTEPEVAENTSTDFAEAVNVWKSTNTWYDTDSVLRGLANGYDEKLMADDPDVTLEDRLVKVTEFVDKYRKAGDTPATPKKVVSDVAAATPRGKRNGDKRKATWKDMTPSQVAAGKKWVKDGAFKNLDEYAQELDELGSLTKR